MHSYAERQARMPLGRYKQKMMICVSAYWRHAVLLQSWHKPPLPEGAWGNRPGTLWVFPPSGGAGTKRPAKAPC